MKFKRSIGAIGLLIAGISSVMGSGWLFGPLFAVQVAGPGAVMAWLLGGLLMTVVALTFAELGSAFPVAGGPIQYAHDTHGPMASFIVGWMVWISSVAVAPVETMGLLQYAANYLPSLTESTAAGVHVLSPIGIATAAAVMLVMCVLNYCGAQFFSRSNTLFSVSKLVVPITTALLLLIFAYHPGNFVSKSPGGFLPYGWHSIFAALPLGGVIYSYIGANTILQLAAETKNPQRTIPFALIGTMLFCTSVYVMLQIAFVGALDVHDFTHGWHKLHFHGDRGPFVGLLTAVGLGWFGFVIYADALISPFGTGYVYTATTARVGYSLSDIGLFPPLFKKLSSTGVPVYSLILNYLVGLILFLPFPGWQGMVSFVISCFIISYVVGPLALVCKRKSQPKVQRPFRLPMAQLIALVAFYICNLLIFWTGWYTVSRMMFVLLIGFLLFIRSLFKRNKGLKFSDAMKNSWWMIPYFAMMALISYLGTFGGGLGVLSFGYDFLTIAVLSLGVFMVAIRSRC